MHMHVIWKNLPCFGVRSRARVYQIVERVPRNGAPIFRRVQRCISVSDHVDGGNQPSDYARHAIKEGQRSQEELRQQGK